jgi:hypothetical protein
MHGAFGTYGELAETIEQFAPALQRALFSGSPCSPRAAPRRGRDHGAAADEHETEKMARCAQT